MTTNHFDSPDGEAMEALRKLTLRTRLAATFDSLIHQASAMRCITLARAVQGAAAEDPACEEIVRNSGIMQFLREEAVARSNGSVLVLPPLLPEPVKHQREVNNV